MKKTTKKPANKNAKKPARRPVKKTIPVRQSAPVVLLAKFAVHNPDVAWRIVDGEAAIVTPADGTLHLLNEVGTAVWEGTQQPVRLDKVVDRVLKEFEVKRAVAEKDVADFARELNEKKMLLLADRKQDLPEGGA